MHLLELQRQLTLHANRWQRCIFLMIAIFAFYLATYSVALSVKPDFTATAAKTGGAALEPVEHQAKTAIDRQPGYRPTTEEIDLLARAVYSEARGEHFEGQVSIAAVIMNRLEHSDFPDSISGVIFEPQAFTAVADGQFWLQPDGTAYRAVEEALKGKDPSGGALYYYNPATAASPWIFSRRPITRIGNHVFAL
jgi:spore germination cell wall hydrolase CwlJ-like protein